MEQNNQAKTKTVGISVTPDEYNEIKRMSEMYGYRSMSALLWEFLIHPALEVIKIFERRASPDYAQNGKEQEQA